MRVGLDARWYNDAGVGTYVAELLRALFRRGDCELIVYESPGNAVPGLGGLPGKRVPVRSTKYSLAAQFELRRCIRQDKLDVFHAPFYVMPLAAGCPVVVTMHDLIPFMFRIYSRPKQWMVKMGYHAAASRAAHIIADSQNAANDIQRILRVPAERITTIHCAVPQDRFHPRGDADELQYLREKFGVQRPYVVVASARNWRTKNLASALQALELARGQSTVEFQTVVYGREGGIDALSGEDRWRGLNLRRTGYVKAGDLASLFRHAHLFIMPSLYEGFGLPILEAMSCGCPVLTSNGGSLAEIAGQGAQVFDPFDVAGMAKAASAILSKPEELERWRVAALSRSAGFSWDQAASQTVSVYHHACRVARRR